MRAVVSYVGYLENGEVFDKSDEFSFELGKHEVIPGFEKAVREMEIGEEKEIRIPAEEAYPYRKEMVVSIPTSQLEASGISPEEGKYLKVGENVGKILSVGKETKIDFNHPLAGKALVFRVKLLSLED